MNNLVATIEWTVISLITSVENFSPKVEISKTIPLFKIKVIAFTFHFHQKTGFFLQCVCWPLWVGVGECVCERNGYTENRKRRGK